MTIDIPEGNGVLCADCGIGKPMSLDPPYPQENDPRLKVLFVCRKQPKWRRMHAELAHRCDDFSPNSEARFVPLPSASTRLALEQFAADVGNDRIAASALATKLSQSPRHEAMKKIESIKEQQPVFGGMLETFYEEIHTLNRVKKTGAIYGKNR